MAKTVLEALHHWAKQEANRPGAYDMAELRDACERELARAADPDAADPGAAVRAEVAAEIAATGLPITDDMIDAAIVASYASAKPAPTTGTAEERLNVMRANEREQMRLALAAAFEVARR